ncbi:nitroreductase family deazaflavin-dependent oxidoreductase [Actinomadura bangladeshensis]|uniref:nitroreductase family deazaflavin-dependent oxidoreductase n=1 Tax=Actinomadura bangladeshensis TaxID=453573 RepID=UPI0030B82FFE
MPDDRPKFFDSTLFAPAMKALTRGHVALFRATGGRLGSRFRFGSAFPSGVPVCLLTTRGRKSGKLRTMALLYLPDGDRVVLVASRGGTGKHPQWYLNVGANPKVAVQTGRRPRPMLARTAEGDERADLWRRLVDFYPEYADYQRWTDRTIPVVICTPT